MPRSNQMVSRARASDRRRFLMIVGGMGVAAIASACGLTSSREPGVAPTAQPVDPPEIREAATPLDDIAPGASASRSALDSHSTGTIPSDTYDPARLTDQLGIAQTDYQSSLSERTWNVDLAAQRLDGTTVAPGEVFSFNQAIGPTTLQAGFRVGYGIAVRNERPETVPSVAGGICQLATTIFQAAYWAGLPIVERHHHSYWIARYGQPPSGKVGFDAAVDDPRADLRFQNTTGDWLRVNTWTDGQIVHCIIHGVTPGWSVESAEPRVFDVVKANQEMIRQPDPTLRSGQELGVEHAEDGFKVQVRRLVMFRGQIADEYDFTNHYRPSRNVTLVGGPPPPAAGTAPRSEPAQPPPVASPAPAPAQPAATPTTRPAEPPAPAPSTTVAPDQPHPTPTPANLPPSATEPAEQSHPTVTPSSADPPLPVSTEVPAGSPEPTSVAEPTSGGPQPQSVSDQVAPTTTPIQQSSPQWRSSDWSARQP